jgi:hypothetical protein
VVLKPLHSKRFAKPEAASQSCQRLVCGGFSTAFPRVKVGVGSWPHHPPESGGERAAPKSWRD